MGNPEGTLQESAEPSGNDPDHKDDCSDIVLRPDLETRGRVGSTSVEVQSTASTIPTESRRPDSKHAKKGVSIPNDQNGSHLQHVATINRQINRSEYPTPLDDIAGQNYLRERYRSPSSICSQNYSIRTLDYPHQRHPDNPTPVAEKKKALTDLLTRTLSLFYALFNITVGLAVYVGDIVDGSLLVPEIFSLILVGIAFIYILYLTIDISIYMAKKRKYEKNLEQMEEFQFDIVSDFTLIKHNYCFSKDRHSGNFYLKIGATAFCFGHLIHSGLLLGYQFVLLASPEYKFHGCASVTTLILDLIYPLYSFLLLFFIFKYSNVIINKNVIMARFGVMHCLSSSICFWIWTIIRETVEAVAHKESDYNTTQEETENDVQVALKRFTKMCDYQDVTMGTIYRDFSPYLYPFSVEFSILVVGVIYLVWQNIALCKADENEEDAESLTQCKTPVPQEESNVTVHVDCHSSNRGLFAGFVVLLITIISSILFFIAIYITEDDGTSHSEVGILINLVTSIIILSFMTLACIFGYKQIMKLDINGAHHNLLDDVLLFICIPAYFLNGVFTIIPAILYSKVLACINVLLEVLQVLIQTLFIVDGLRRSSNTKQLRKKKPGRELVTFLVISNIALWLMQTFEVKSHDIQDYRYDFYGKELWTILGHLCLPLMMFYRFHSSVCFGDVWKYAYEPSGH